MILHFEILGKVVPLGMTILKNLYGEKTVKSKKCYVGIFPRPKNAKNVSFRAYHNFLGGAPKSLVVMTTLTLLPPLKFSL